MKKAALISLIFASCMQMSFSQVPDQYLGLTPPGNTPEVFAPGIVSLTGRNERVITTKTKPEPKSHTPRKR